MHENSAAVWPSFMAGQVDRPVRVVVVDDDAHIRRVIAQELMGDPRTLLVGEADSLREGKRVVREREFDVILVDLNLGDGRGYDLIAYAKELRGGGVEAVVVSVLEADEDVMRAFELGASGFIVKSSWFGGYVQSVLQVANGGASITPSLARRLLQRLDRGNAVTRRFPMQARCALTGREGEVLRMIAVGMTSAEIGERLGISHMTVNSHVKNIYQKLHVKNRAQAVSWASRWGLL
ncbi:response regulator transcription factor [Ramlibacter sp.]|uniref:response regulator transcription factor n=1 Tax=Ramlibacter sp. TaxID=1917967 RepID=UPI002C3836CD|nr:response regulator transcription factor [Ramlibacter sp.]HWI81102.1 response regulator transcription factor [Ramlibacter sp.]